MDARCGMDSIKPSLMGVVTVSQQQEITKEPKVMPAHYRPYLNSSSEGMLYCMMTDIPMEQGSCGSNSSPWQNIDRMTRTRVSLECIATR